MDLINRLNRPNRNLCVPTYTIGVVGIDDPKNVPKSDATVVFIAFTLGRCKQTINAFFLFEIVEKRNTIIVGIV